MTKKKILLLLLAVVILLGCVLCILLSKGILLFHNLSRQDFPVRGVDVSSYQGEIDWNVLAGEGIQFAFIKATEGSAHTDK